MYKFIFVICFLLIAVSSHSFAAIPLTMSWQGTIKDSNGDNLNGSFEFTFSIYESSTGGSAIWSETLTGVPVADGLVSVILGKIEPIDLPFGDKYYFGISINSGNELPHMLSKREPQILPN